MTDGPDSPALWAPDPHDPNQLRYWDGERWTEHVVPVPPPHQASQATPAIATKPKRFIDRKIGPIPIWVIPVVVVVAPFALVEWGIIESGDKGASDTRRTALRYTWNDSLCTRDDYSGVITNTDSRTFTGKVWATGTDEAGNRVRDQDIVVDLAPGASETIEFVWVLDGRRATCSLDSVEWYP